MEDEQIHATAEFLNALHLKCPCCGQLTKPGTTPPRSKKGWTKFTCSNPHCKKVNTSNKWLCSCGTLWRTCHIHASRPDHHDCIAANPDIMSATFDHNNANTLQSRQARLHARILAKCPRLASRINARNTDANPPASTDAPT